MIFNSELEPLERPLWAPTGHTQTILAYLLPSPVLAAAGERVQLDLGDGDQLVGRRHAGGSETVVHLFHGLTGNADAAYMHRTAAVCLRQGHTVYRWNHRGCGEGVGLARHPYHSGRGEDISAVIEHSRAKDPDKRQIAIGFSLSGNALLCLLTGIRGTHKPDAAITVNAPIDLRSVAFELGRGLNCLYDFQFVNSLRRTLIEMHRRGLFEKRFKIGRRTSLRAFDDLYTAPAGGFANGEDYYAKCSTWNQLHLVDRPTVVLTARDDPFVNFAAYARASYSDQINFCPQRVGGHLGYLSARKTPLGTRRWLDYALDYFVRALTERRGRS